MIPLVLVHGFLGGGDQWNGQAPLGEARDLVAVDLPGFGKNAHLPAVDRIEGFAAWVLDHLSDRGIERFDLLGHSMGGMIVQEMIRAAPERVDRLVLYGTGARGALPGRFETIATSKDRARADGVAATGRRIATTWFREGSAAPGYAATAAIAELPGLEAVLAGLDAMEHWNGQDHLGAIRADTLILWGIATVPMAGPRSKSFGPASRTAAWASFPVPRMPFTAKDPCFSIAWSRISWPEPRALAPVPRRLRAEKRGPDCRQFLKLKLSGKWNLNSLPLPEAGTRRQVTAQGLGNIRSQEPN